MRCISEGRTNAKIFDNSLSFISVIVFNLQCPLNIIYEGSENLVLQDFVHIHAVLRAVWKFVISTPHMSKSIHEAALSKHYPHFVFIQRYNFAFKKSLPMKRWSFISLAF